MGGSFWMIKGAKYKLGRVAYGAILLFSIYACSSKGINDRTVVDVAETFEKVDFNQSFLSIEGDIQPFNTEIKIDTFGEDRFLVHLSLYTDFPSSLPQFQMKIKYPMTSVHSLWSSRTWSNQSYINIPNYSRLQSDYNIVSAMSKLSKNRITVATFDDFESDFTQIDIKQAPDSLVFSFNFFNDAVPDAEILEYKATVFVDLSDQQFSRTIRDASQWRLDQEGNKTITKMDDSMKPIYSLWYPLDRNIPLENITYYFDSIASMGFRSILFDDGWQNVVRFEVDTAGIWDPSKIEIVGEFIEKARDADMKVALWYSHPFIGAHNYVFKKYEGKYLQYRTSSQPILDIRYPDVREYITQMYTSIVTEWGIDGVLFDFLNGYYPDEHIISSEDKGRDFVSVRKALDSLRTSMEYEMRYVNPELMINQSYHTVGPLHTSNTKTINGFLGITVLNEVREKLVNNRLLYGEYSPFMEVMGVHPKDPAIDVARKFQTILFGTPYISYFSYTLPEDVRETLSFWMKYWKSNTQYLLEGDFEAYNPVQRYPVIIGGNQMKQILIFYDRVSPFDLGSFDFEMADVINSSDFPYVSVSGTPLGRVDYITYDYKGKYIGRGALKFKRDIATIEIPVGGYARLIVK
jgi:alpha-galactosidase